MSSELIRGFSGASTVLDFPTRLSRLFREICEHFADSLGLPEHAASLGLSEQEASVALLVVSSIAVISFWSGFDDFLLRLDTNFFKCLM
jgi:hypothetical protein